MAAPPAGSGRPPGREPQDVLIASAPEAARVRAGAAFLWRRALIYTHRWLGIAGCILFVLWFVSGVVMMYARMPDLSSADRRALMPSLDLTTATATPADVLWMAGAPVQSVRVGMFGRRPVYRFAARGRWTAAFADDRQWLGDLPREWVLDEVRRFVPAHSPTVQYDALLTEPDQWTIESRSLLPMHRVAVGDEADTYFYLSDRTGEPVVKTTRRTRRWAYAGAVVHWIYFTPFRRNGELWAQSIIWASAAGSLLCLSGLVWGVWRYSPLSRYRLKRVASHTPYAGWMSWHHYAGLLFGFTTFTWMFSGLLSMDPWNWHPGTAPTRTQREAVSGGPLDLDRVTLAHLRTAVAALQSAAPKEIELVQFMGEPFALGGGRLVSAVNPERAFGAIGQEEMLGAARAAMPGVEVEDAVWLSRYDAYYYDRTGERPLPVLRVRYADATRTWLYLDPGRGAIVRKEERLSRLNRWLYHGFHSFDFPFLYYRRPLWDIVVVALSIGGLVSSVTAFEPAWRRLRRHGRRLLRRA